MYYNNAKCEGENVVYNTQRQKITRNNREKNDL